MDAKDHGEHGSNACDKNSICSLEWIAWAIEAARRHKENEHSHSQPARPEDPLDSDDE
jgi:hypothetical protein